MTSPFWTLAYWADVGERAIKTGAQSVGVGFTFSETGPFNLFDMDLGLVGGFFLSGALFSVITSLASAPLGGGTASVLPAVATSVAPLPPPPP